MSYKVKDHQYCIFPVQLNLLVMYDGLHKKAKCRYSVSDSSDTGSQLLMTPGCI